MKTDPVLLQSELPGIPLFRRGKVRDIYDLGDSLLFVTTDRVSAFDVVMPNGIPGKGTILTQMSLFWFDLVRDIVPNHVIASEVDAYPNHLHPFRDQLEGRSMLVVKADRIDLECIVRGYISGSLWKELTAARMLGLQSVHGFRFDKDLIESGRLPEPIFSPSSKNDSGHDENISFEAACQLVGSDLANRLRQLSIAIYQRAAAHAAERGIIIADTKFEFGLHNGAIILIDEILSPDSSRFWPAAGYSPGGTQPSFDKQPIRDYLESTGWNKKPPAPTLPGTVITAAAHRYAEAQRLLTGPSSSNRMLQ